MKTEIIRNTHTRLYDIKTKVSDLEILSKRSTEVLCDEIMYRIAVSVADEVMKHLMPAIRRAIDEIGKPPTFGEQTKEK